MSKRGMWILNCVLWAVIWGVLGLFFFPFWLFTVLSLLIVLVPVGVPEKHEPKHVHNPEAWNKHGKS